jgi:hypothetical protein
MSLRFFRKPWLVLTTAFLLALSVVRHGTTADPVTEENFRLMMKSISAQNDAATTAGRRIGNLAKTPYNRAFPVGSPRARSYSKLRISGGAGGTDSLHGFHLFNWERQFSSTFVKGVLVGRPPEPLVPQGKVEPIGIPNFDYALLAEEEGVPRRVELTFGLADGRTWSFDVAAAVVTPMTAVALDERLLLFTLTAPSAEDEQEERLTSGEAVHPALQGHRLAYRPAILDLFADDSGRHTGETKARLDSLRADLEAKQEETLEPYLPQLNRLVQTKLPEESKIWLLGMILAQAPPLEYPLSAVMEKPWKLNEQSLGTTNRQGILNPPAVHFVQRAVYSSLVTRGDIEGDYREYPVSSSVNRDVIASMSNAERELLQEFNEAVIVHRIVYWASQGKIDNFDRKKRWSDMIDELAPIYLANLDATIDAQKLKRRSWQWREVPLSRQITADIKLQ